MAILIAEPNIARDKLMALRSILEKDVEARTDLEALARKLMGGQ